MELLLCSTVNRYLHILGEVCLQPLILLVFRLHWGWQLHQSGMGKLRNHEGVVEFFTGLGIPLPGLNAWFVGGVEGVGGLLLAVGFLSRPTALLVSGVMFVAYISVEEDRAKLLNLFTDPEKFISADPFFFLFTALLVAAFGPGRFSLDYLISRFAPALCGGNRLCGKPTE